MFYSYFILEATKEKLQTAGTSITASSNVMSKSNQPMPAIIRKPIQSSASKASDAASDAVTAITKNKELTVTPRHVTASTAKVLPVTGVNNSITLSPIPTPASNVTKYIGGGVSITPQSLTKVNNSLQGRTISPISKGNASSPVPISIAKATTNQSNNSKVTTKPNILSSRNTNTNMVMVSQAKTTSPSTTFPTNARILNNSQSVVPKIGTPRTAAAATASSSSNKPFIVAQTKAQVSASQTTNNRPAANNSPIQINRVLTAKPRPVDKSSLLRPKIVGNRTNTMPIESRKRLANESVPLEPAKRTKHTMNSSLNASVS